MLATGSTDGTAAIWDLNVRILLRKVGYTLVFMNFRIPDMLGSLLVCAAVKIGSEMLSLFTRFVNARHFW